MDASAQQTASSRPGIVFYALAVALAFQGLSGVAGGVVLGIGPLVALGGLLRERPWSKRASFAVGIALIVWIGVEIAVIGYHAQPSL